MALAVSRNAARAGATPLVASRSRCCRLVVRASHQDKATGGVSVFPNHVLVQHNVPKDKLQAKGVFGWPTWSCEVSTFPWSYDSNEDAYILEGRVIVTPEDGQPTEIKAGDFCTFPVGMSCTWDVKEPVRKHYSFHS